MPRPYSVSILTWSTVRTIHVGVARVENNEEPCLDVARYMFTIIHWVPDFGFIFAMVMDT
jgi:hypothetical protein